jgi:voltage-gated potassium channel
MGRLRHIALGIAALVVLTVVGTAGYMHLEGYNVREALFFTVGVLATEGLQVRPLGAGGQALTIALVVLGIGVVLYTVGLIAQQMIEGELQALLGRRRMQRTIEGMHGHVIVCGFGRMGQMVCGELLSKPMPFIVVDRDERVTGRVEEHGYAFIAGDATEEESLRRAGIERASALVTVLPSDAENVFLTLTARALVPALTIVARAESESGAERLRQAGASRVVSPYAIGGHRMAQAILRPAVLDFVDLTTHHRSVELQFEEVPISRGGTLSLADSGVREHVDVMVIAIRRSNGETRFNPSPDEMLAQGDRLLVIGQAQSLKRLERALA